MSWLSHPLLLRAVSEGADRETIGGNHHLGAGIVAVTAEGDPGRRPVCRIRRTSRRRASDLDPARRLARTQDDGDRTRALGIVDVDRQEAPLIVIGVEQGQLLAAMNDVAAVVDIEDDRIRLLSVAGNPLVDQRIGQPHDIPKRGRILQARDRRLRAQDQGRCPATGHRPA